MAFRPPFVHQAPWIKLISLLIIIFFSMAVFSVLATLISMPLFGTDVLQNLGNISDTSSPDQINQLKFFQIISQLGLFIVPAVIFLLFYTDDRKGYIQIKGKFPTASFLVASAVMLLALPMINWFLKLNMLMELPAGMGGIEQWMKDSEQQAGDLTEAFLVSGNIGDLMINLLMIAIIPAIGEELLFRGILQRLFRDWTKNIHAGIIISALLFSFIHFQFYGFLPRFLMGVMFGYMLYWSGSLWVPIIAHFMNNATAVIVAWLGARYYPEMDYNSFGSSDNTWIILLSALSCGLVLVFIWMKRKKGS